MFKRVTWMGVGMAVGAAGAFRAKRKLEETVERYLPEQVADRAAASARGLGRTVRAAAVEGREAMRSTEADLRSRVEARTFVGRPPAPAVTAPGGAGADSRGAGREPERPGPAGARRASRQPGPRTGPTTTRRRARR